MTEHRIPESAMTTCTCACSTDRPTTPSPVPPVASGERTRRRLGIVALVVLLMIGGGVATASWLATGTGVGQAAATTVQNLVVSTASPTATLYPKPAGGYSNPATGTVVATVDNPNPFPVTLTSASIGTVTVTPQPGKTCAAGYVVPTSPSKALTPAVLVPANATGVQITVPGALEMLATAEDGCQGATFRTTLTVSGALA
ncbi:hypothetical protein ACWKWC_15660 [Geodermatophilus nigrescens]